MTRKPHPFSRRDFIGAAAAGACALAAPRANSAVPVSPRKKPNILWIMSDEHNASVTGCYGNKLVRTPSIDSLAEGGVTFDSHYCNSPLCTPSRLSITAGKYVSRVNAWALTSELPSAEIPSLPRVLNAAGYQSFLCGKQHYDYTRRYGFTEVGGDFNKWYKTGLGRRLPPTHLTQERLSPRFNEFHPGDKSATLDHDRRVCAGAVDFLSQQQYGDKPFFLFTGFLAPHFPLVVPEEFWQPYQGKVDMPRIPPGFLETLPLNYKVQRAGFEEIGVPDETVQRGRELYYGLTSWVDVQIGKVLAALKLHPEVAENTVIIYSSDHGENMGEHGLWWKNCMYDASSRVPLVMHFPQRWKGGQRRAGASSHVDLVRTIVDIAGGHAPADWNGDSMLPWLDRPTAKWKDFAISEYYAHNTASGYVMARSGQWKYVYHTVIDRDHGAQRELYDLAVDPDEFHNLAEDPQQRHRVQTLHARMVREVGANPDDTEQRSRAELSKGYTRPDPRPKGTWVNEES